MSKHGKAKERVKIRGVVYSPSKTWKAETVDPRTLLTTKAMRPGFRTNAPTRPISGPGSTGGKVPMIPTPQTIARGGPSGADIYRQQRGGYAPGLEPKIRPDLRTIGSVAQQRAQKQAAWNPPPNMSQAAPKFQAWLLTPRGQAWQRNPSQPPEGGWGRAIRAPTSGPDIRPI